MISRLCHLSISTAVNSARPGGKLCGMAVSVPLRERRLVHPDAPMCLPVENDQHVSLVGPSMELDPLDFSKHPFSAGADVSCSAQQRRMSLLGTTLHSPELLQQCDHAPKGGILLGESQPSGKGCRFVLPAAPPSASRRLSFAEPVKPVRRRTASPIVQSPEQSIFDSKSDSCSCCSHTSAPNSELADSSEEGSPARAVHMPDRGRVARKGSGQRRMVSPAPLRGEVEERLHRAAEKLVLHSHDSAVAPDEDSTDALDASLCRRRAKSLGSMPHFSTVPVRRFSLVENSKGISSPPDDACMTLVTNPVLCSTRITPNAPSTMPTTPRSRGTRSPAATSSPDVPRAPPSLALSIDCVTRDASNH